MHRKTPVHHQLYHHLFPAPSHADPPSFTAHLARNLVPEVRVEVATFYGDLNSVEARYPGLDYCYLPHRLRLGRFPHHRRLFEAFEALGLTEQEIQDLCCWEGSKWARQKYEEDQGVKVHDTTGDDIVAWLDPRHMTESERSKRPRSRKLLNSRPIDDRQRSRQDTITVIEQIRLRPKPDPQVTVFPEQLDVMQIPPSLVPRARTPLQDLQDQIVQAWADGRDLPAEVEALVKDHVERGEIPEDFFANARSMAEMQRFLLRDQAHRRDHQPALAL